MVRHTENYSKTKTKTNNLQSLLGDISNQIKPNRLKDCVITKLSVTVILQIL